MHFALLSAKLPDYPRSARFGPGIRLLGNMNLCADFEPEEKVGRIFLGGSGSAVASIMEMQSRL
jgi:hypothetical protein